MQQPIVVWSRIYICHQPVYNLMQMNMSQSTVQFLWGIFFTEFVTGDKFAKKKTHRVNGNISSYKLFDPRKRRVV